MQEEDTFLGVIRELSWMNLDMKTVKLKSTPRSPEEMRQVAMETGCGQHLAGIWGKARTLEREDVGESVPSRSSKRGGSVLKGRGAQPGLWVLWWVWPTKAMTEGLLGWGL